MAISGMDFGVYLELVEANLIPPEPDVLELGEANWYGGVEIAQLVEVINRNVRAETRIQLLQRLESLFSGPLNAIGFFEVAKIFYQAFLGYRSITSIDLSGTDRALRYDLNYPVPLDRKFHIVINTGTAEHVFNVFQFFKTAHEVTLPGGLMIHTLPLAGWLDHGFYNFNPTFIADLAAANDYKILLWVYGELDPLKAVKVTSLGQLHAMAKQGEMQTNSLQCAVMRKTPEERSFAIPSQGYYAQRLSEQEQRDWYSMR